jgi:hypothetical protein
MDPVDGWHPLPTGYRTHAAESTIRRQVILFCTKSCNLPSCFGIMIEGVVSGAVGLATPFRL